MDAKRAIDDHLRPRLEDSFGKAMTMLIFASATLQANVPVLDPSRDDFLRLVDAVCSDERVVDMWGSAGARDAAQRWRSLVS